MTKKQRPVKCGTCSLFDSRELMTQNEKGRYFHLGECFEKHLEEIANKQLESEFRRKEFLKRDSLVKIIAQVHKLESYQEIPRSFYPHIEELRNDTKLFGKLKKNYKNGIKYEAIEYTYLFCKEKIEWAKSNKEFKNTLSELRYGLAIVRNNIADARNHFNKTKVKNSQVEKLKENIKESVIINEKVKEVQKLNLMKNENKEEKVNLSTLFD